MKLHLLLPVAVCALSLAACQKQEPEVVGGPVDPLANQLANAAPVELPPAVQSTKAYRCSPGNSLYYVDFFNDDLTANIRAKSKQGTPTKLTAAEKGQAFEGDGYSVSGNGDTVTISTPDAKGLSCHT